MPAIPHLGQVAHTSGWIASLLSQQRERGQFQELVPALTEEGCGGTSTGPSETAQESPGILFVLVRHPSTQLSVTYQKPWSCWPVCSYGPPRACSHTYLVYAYKDVGHTIPWVLWSCVRGATRSPAENFGTQAAPREGMAQPPRSPSWWPCGLSAVGKTGRE